MTLSNLEPFGIGGRRLCYTHPHDVGKCVKVLRTDEQRTVRVKKYRLIPTSWRREYDNNAHEQAMLEALHRKIGPDMGLHFPISYGVQPTDLGLGLVLDLIRDHDGKIARSLRELITVGVPLETFRPAFQQFADFLLKHVVLTRGLHDHNLVAQQQANGSYRLYLIDGFGDPAWLPFARWFHPLGRAKVRNRIAAAWPKMERFAASGGVSQELLEKSTWGQGILNHRGE